MYSTHLFPANKKGWVPVKQDQYGRLPKSNKPKNPRRFRLVGEASGASRVVPCRVCKHNVKSIAKKIQNGNYVLCSFEGTRLVLAQVGFQKELARENWVEYHGYTPIEWSSHSISEIQKILLPVQ